MTLIVRFGLIMFGFSTAYLGAWVVISPETMVWGGLGRFLALSDAFLLGVVFYSWESDRDSEPKT